METDLEERLAQPHFLFHPVSALQLGLWSFNSHSLSHMGLCDYLSQCFHLLMLLLNVCIFRKSFNILLALSYFIWWFVSNE